MGSDLKAQRQKLVETKVDAFLNVVADRDGLLPGPLIYDEFVLGEDGRTLYLKDGLKQVTWKNDSTRYLALKGLGRSAEWIRAHLFPYYKSTPVAPRRNRKTQAALTNVKDQLAATETVDLPQRASDVDTAVKRLVGDATSTHDEDALPLRELLGLNRALQRTRGALVDNIARLSQLDNDIALAEEELGGEEAANDPEKKRRIQEELDRLRDERASRLEAAATNRDTLRSQFSRIRETVERVLNEDTTLAERLRTLFREQGVTITSILTALGFIVSTIVLAIQNAAGAAGVTPAPTPSPGGTVTDWVKKQLKTLAGWLKALAGKAAAALPGVIGAIVSWLLKTAGSVAVWLAENLWALAVALAAAVGTTAVYYRKR